VIDFHCHLDLYEDPLVVLTQAVEYRCYMLAVTTTPLAWAGTRRLVGGAPRVQVGLGLHPELVASRHREVELLCSMVPDAKYVGEIGLDGSRPHRGSLALQKEVFASVLQACVDTGGRIMTIHSRGAATEVLDALEAHPGAGIPVLHWFSGTQSELARADMLGCWFSVGPTMLRSKKGRQLAAAMPRDRVLTETDGPFTRRGRSPLMPWDVLEAERLLGEIWGTSQAGARRHLLSNLRRLVDAGD